MQAGVRYAIATGRAERDISADLRGTLVPVVSRIHASLTDLAEVGALLRSIDGYEAQPITAAALKLRRSSSYVRGSCAERGGRSSNSTAPSGASLVNA